MRNLKRMAAFLTALILCLGLSVTAFAAESDTGFSDVDAGDWYAEAAVYCRDNGLMAGTGETTFSPDTPMTRGMLVTVLYRLAGSPSLEDEDLGYPFADVPGDSWYADGVYWARLNGVVSGYSDSAFGPNDPLTREQLAAILWRYAGSPAAEGSASFADESGIASWAASAVDWAQESGYISGVGGNRFDPDGTATRAQVAVILMRYDQAQTEEPSPEPAPEEGTDVLVAYFSATGNTENIAEHHHRPGHAGGCAPADPGRGHQQRGHPDRAPGAEGHGPADPGPHQLRHCPPAVHHQERRLHPGDEGR